MEVRSKIWLAVDGEPVFGSGREALLKAIDKLGSINKASQDIHLSYRKALSYIQTMEKRLGARLVERKAGGLHGGGASLTKEAKEFLRKYERLEEGVNEMLDKKFLEIFENGEMFNKNSGVRSQESE
ncbi:MAG TPA: LysR family transcriptional regulator [Nitrospirae bacterium]|nr:LysR family transcriptional regulator [Nitrospirota bacterium]HDZ02044.1 LysR family transcriptional regulator [Nitrospirota bacterium]